MGAEAGPLRAALTGAVGAGRGVSVGAGAGAPVWSSPQAATASMMIAENTRATGLTCASPFSCGAGRRPRPLHAPHPPAHPSASVYHAQTVALLVSLLECFPRDRGSVR